MTKNNRIVVILGSIRKPRMNDRVATWVVGQLEARGFETEIVDPRDAELLPLQIGDKDAQ